MFHISILFVTTILFVTDNKVIVIMGNFVFDKKITMTRKTKITAWILTSILGLLMTTSAFLKLTQNETAIAQAAGAGDECSFGDAQNAGSSTKRLGANGKVYYFDYDSNIVRDSDKPAINTHASNLAKNPNSKAMLEGHTDPRGSREYNIGLGERRAKSVAEEMASNGVDPNQIRIVSYGAEKLASNGYTEDDYQKDRRVVLNVQR